MFVPQKDIGYLIKNINDKLKVKADADLKHSNLTLAQSRVLAFLDSRGGQATQKEIEVYLEVSHPTVVGIISRMERNGHLRCWVDETDKRNKIVALTEQAKALGEEMEQRILANEKMLLASLSEADIKKLKQMLLIIYNNLE
ncbi:MarR family transcriptional regulator [Clostridium sp. AF20-7]|uniref:MarR family winged helix-turn-helix transcriptional regulator n=1 Tax=Clostridium sp. AF20-7 TaxID=2293002 RepID=UPI001FA96E81|nr:MarR family transcriptional regulator [Clostridium sp. AF20-7]